VKCLHYRAPFDGICHLLSSRFLVVHISPTRAGELNSHHPHSPVRVEGILTAGCCPVPRRDRLRHCCHHLSAMQPSARRLTPWVRWTRALSAVRGRIGLDFGGEASLNILQINKVDRPEISDELTHLHSNLFALYKVSAALYR
jgi:hypothetical protein